MLVREIRTKCNGSLGSQLEPTYPPAMSMPLASAKSFGVALRGSCEASLAWALPPARRATARPIDGSTIRFCEARKNVDMKMEGGAPQMVRRIRNMKYNVILKHSLLRRRTRMAWRGNRGATCSSPRARTPPTGSRPCASSSAPRRRPAHALAPPACQRRSSHSLTIEFK